MFTGLVSFVFDFSLDGKDFCLYASSEFLKQISIGDSICINGICLTVVEIKKEYCKFQISDETISKTNILLFSGKVNVELSLKYGDYLGGHLISGHVFSTGKVLSFSSDGNLWVETFNNKDIKYKDSIAINGVSLTIAEINDTKIRLSLIPETIKRTNFSNIKEGDIVNLEFNTSSIHMSENNPENSEDDWMRLALEEAEKGIETTAPNPWVGCVITKNNFLISKGYHEKAGLDHAEVMAFKNCHNKELLKGATLYCTLEPCCHLETLCYPNPCLHKEACPLGQRSASCADSIIQHNIKKVVVGIVDPDVRVSGKGISKLREAGIEVVMASEKVEKEIRYSLRHYIYQRSTGLPYVTVKIALTVDGCYSSNDVKWITHKNSRNELYKIWKRCQAVVLGARTVEKDNPLLDASDFSNEEEKKGKGKGKEEKGKEGKGKGKEEGKEEEKVKGKEDFNFKKIIFDGDSLIHTDSKIFTKNAYIVTKDIEKWKDISCNKILVDDLYDIKTILEKINVMHVLVEGGANLQKSFLQSGLVNEIIIFRGSKIFGNNGYHWEIPSLDVSLVETKTISYNDENNIMERYFIKQKVSENNNREEFDDVEYAIREFKKGNMVLVMDDEKRENEGDLIVAAAKITEKQMTELINVTTGIICVPMENSRAKKLNLPLMCENNNDPHKTAFTVSVDFKDVGTGVSSQDRLKTVHALANENTYPNDLRRPGHIFPLIGNEKGLKARQGHTEASLALCKLADISPPVAVIGELKNIDGTMKRKNDCFKYARVNNIPIITVEKLAEFKKKKKIQLLSECDLKCKIGEKEWKFLCFESGKIDAPHKVLIYGNIDLSLVSVRIHSECFTGDVLKSEHCDCGQQLKLSMKYITNQGHGIIIFPSGHEGRGIGITEKVKAYKLQKDLKIDTFEANKRLGHNIDVRTYEDIYKIFKFLKIEKIELLTENPDKIKAFKNMVVKNIPMITKISEYNERYLKNKRELFSKGKGKEKEKEDEKTSPLIDVSLTDIENKTIAIVYSMWHEKYITQIRNILKGHLNEAGVKNIIEYEVPGSNEIPFLASKITNKVHGIICVGILIKGDTLHFENVSSAVSNGIMQVQINSGIPIMNCILSCLDFEQVRERVTGNKCTLDYIVKGLLKTMSFSF